MYASTPCQLSLRYNTFAVLIPTLHIIHVSLHRIRLFPCLNWWKILYFYLQTFNMFYQNHVRKSFSITFRVQGGRAVTTVPVISTSTASAHRGDVVFGSCRCPVASRSATLRAPRSERLMLCHRHLSQMHVPVLSVPSHWFCWELYNEYQKSWESLKKTVDKELKEQK